jgi:hypothetical protein
MQDQVSAIRGALEQLKEEVRKGRHHAGPDLGPSLMAVKAVVHRIVDAAHIYTHVAVTDGDARASARVMAARDLLCGSGDSEAVVQFEEDARSALSGFERAVKTRFGV